MSSATSGSARMASIDVAGGGEIMTAMAALGAFLGQRLRQRPRPLRALAWILVPLAFALAVVVWYRMERQLVALPYGLVAFWVGAWTMRKLAAMRTR